MVITVAVSVGFFLVFWLLQRAGAINLAGGRGAEWRRGAGAGLYVFYKSVFAMLTPPLAIAFWNGLSAGTVTLGDWTRTLYTGNGQTYALYILYYFLILYAASNILHHL